MKTTGTTTERENKRHLQHQDKWYVNKNGSMTDKWAPVTDDQNVSEPISGSSETDAGSCLYECDQPLVLRIS